MNFFLEVMSLILVVVVIFTLVFGERFVIVREGEGFFLYWLFSLDMFLCYGSKLYLRLVLGIYKNDLEKENGESLSFLFF